MTTLYLAGAIRDGHPEDVQWREDLIDALTKVQFLVADDSVVEQWVKIINPLANKFHNEKTKQWTIGPTVEAGSKLTYTQDLWSVRRADIIVANLIALAEGYPNIGTLVEIGAAVGMGGKATFSIIPETYSGHQNPGNFKLHPFLEQSSAHVFHGVKECIDYLVCELPSLAGLKPRFGGVTNVD